MYSAIAHTHKKQIPNNHNSNFEVAKPNGKKRREQLLLAHNTPTYAHTQAYANRDLKKRMQYNHFLLLFLDSLVVGMLRVIVHKHAPPPVIYSPGCAKIDRRGASFPLIARGVR